MSAHAPGVLRAARMCAVHSIDMDSSARHFAEIIDRETGARELLEALKALHTHTKNNHCICGLNTQAEQAIAKAEGRA